MFFRGLKKTKSIMFHKFYARVDILGYGAVKLDDKELACREFKVESNAGELSTVTLTLNCDDIELDIETKQEAFDFGESN